MSVIKATNLSMGISQRELTNDCSRRRLRVAILFGCQVLAGFIYDILSLCFGHGDVPVQISRLQPVALGTAGYVLRAVLVEDDEKGLKRVKEGDYALIWEASINEYTQNHDYPEIYQPTLFI